MKKFILPILAGSVLFAACGETATEENKAPETTVATEEPKTEQPTEQPTTTTETPNFSNDEVNKGLGEYATLLDEYKKAIAAKDQAKLAELNTKFQDWAKTAGTWAAKLKPEEAQQFSTYMQKLVQDWAAAAQSAAQ